MQYAVGAHADHIAKVTAVRKPLLAVAELVWNAFDADAKRVDIIVEPSPLGGIDAIEVVDDGWGMSPKQALDSFSGLGGSWKKKTTKTEHEGRLIHGKEGQGRFKSLALGRVAEWFVTYPLGSSKYSFVVKIISDTSNRFDISDEREAEAGDTRGVRVRISELYKAIPSLERESATEELAQVFALYMRKYKDVELFLNGSAVDPKAIEDCATPYPMPAVKLGSEEYPAVLEIVEWKVTAERRLYLCNAEGFPLDEMPPGISAPGFNFTAYLKSNAFEILAHDGNLGLGDLDDITRPVIDEAKRVLRDHFRRRSEETARGLVAQWKAEKIYPYKSEPRNEAEEQERQVFNIAALNVSSYLPKFSEADPKAKQLQLRLLRHAIETGPADALRFLTEALELPAERRQELANLLDRTTLSDMIGATKLVTDRLEFLQGLQELVFDSDLQKATKERRQLHRILSPNAWIFGEQYHLSADDQNLTTVLKKHLEILGDETAVDDPVERVDGSQGVIDLMLSRCIVRPGVAAREHLVVELKRPSVNIGLKEAGQIESYAIAVAEDERFKDTQTRWVFWIVGKDVTSDARKRAHQAGRPNGILYQDEDHNITVWVKTWAQVLEEATARMRFFQEKLGYTPDRDASRLHLRTAYAKHVGELFATPESDAPRK